MKLIDSNEQLIIFFKENFQNNYFFDNNHTLLVSSSDLIKKFSLLKSAGFIMLLDICGVDNSEIKIAREKHSTRLYCVYHFLNMQLCQRVRVKVSLEIGQALPSIVHLWKGADWFEREAWDMFGIKFEKRKLERILTHSDFKGHPLLKDFDLNVSQSLSEPPVLAFEEDIKLSDFEKEQRMSVSIGPSHPSIKDTLRIILEVEGEKIIRVKQDIGYLHRGFEKICESKGYNQIVTYTDRLNYSSAAMNNIGWCKAIEDMMEIEIPDRAKALRMIMAELSRVLDHLFCIANMAFDAGVVSNFYFCFDLREKIIELLEKYCGARLMTSMTRVGGMVNDIPDNWIGDCREVVKHISKEINELDSILTTSRLWADRTKVCTVSAKDAIAWGYTGPCLRASGINYDLRKMEPYYFYNDVSFEVPLGVNGQCFDRYLVRIEEIRQSLKIVEQVVENIPTGSIIIDDDRVSLPQKDLVHTLHGAFVKHRNIIEDGIRPKASEIYSATEAANGELGFYIISDGEKSPYRVKVRPPCFAIYQSYGETLQNLSISDAIVNLGSMNIIPGELDR